MRTHLLTILDQHTLDSNVPRDTHIYIHIVLFLCKYSEYMFHTQKLVCRATCKQPPFCPQVFFRIHKNKSNES